MSQEVFCMLKNMDIKEINLQLAMQCAPVITGIKISNLLIIQEENEKGLEELLVGTDLMYFRMFRYNKKVTYLIFRKREMEEYLSKKEVREFFHETGYQKIELGKILINFQKRYWDYMIRKMEFPHEMGLLLGYPLEDVKGFVENNGMDFLFSGYWKVYANLKEKTGLFKKYDKAQEELIYLVSEGLLIKEIAFLYEKEQSRKVAC